MAFDDFGSERVTVNGIQLFVRTGGAGPPLLLLHGFPESHRCWATVAPDLAAHFTVVCPDLRGYGQSEKPPGDGGETYVKRTMAGDGLELDEADAAAGARLAPVLALWEQPPGAALPFDPLAIWRRWAPDVRGEPITSGHFLPEEAPEAVTSALLQFLPTSAA